jgi:hexosaminidase
LIGWDEILEGGLAPNAIVMSWRGEKGGITAATQNHQVIMTPSSPVYFDHTQTRNEDSIVIGGYNSLEAVYAYEPIPRELPADKARYVWGGQANVWTEYMRYPSKVEYMIFPRMSALSEVLWSPKESRNWSSFEKRLQTQFRRYELWKAGYSKAYYDVKVSLLPDPNTKGILVMAEPRDKTGQVTYSINGKTANRYSKPVLISQTGDVLVSYTKEGKVVNEVPLRFSFNKATGKKASIAKTPNGKYPGQGGALSLVNGIYSNKGLSHPDWLGWIGDDIEAVIDLGTPTVIDSVRLHTLDQNGSWVYLPQYVEVLGSPDGKSFTSMGRASSFVKDTLTMGWINVPIQKKKTRYIKVLAKNYGIIPEGKPGGGTRSWIFTDEIQVY